MKQLYHFLKKGKPKIDFLSKNFTPSRNPENFTAAQKFGGQNIKRLPKIGEGRDRNVFLLGPDKVLKVAKNPQGLKQNAQEQNLEYLNDYKIKHYETGKDYVVMEKIGPPGKETTKLLRPVRSAISNAPFSRVGASNHYIKDKDHPIIQDALRTAGLDEFRDYGDVSLQDLTAQKNWGEKNGKPILIDAGGLSAEAVSQSKYKPGAFGRGYMQDPEWREVRYERDRYKTKGKTYPYEVDKYAEKPRTPYPQADIKDFPILDKSPNDILHIPIDIAYEMRRRGSYIGDMSPKRTDTTMNAIRASMQAGRIEPINATVTEFKGGRLQDGKHRILIAKQLGMQTYPINVEPDRNARNDNQIYLEGTKIPMKRGMNRKYNISREGLSNYITSEGNKSGAFVMPSVIPQKTIIGTHMANLNFDNQKNIRYLSNVLGHEEVHTLLQDIDTPKKGISEATKKYDSIVIPTVMQSTEKYKDIVLNPYSSQEIDPKAIKDLRHQTLEEDRPIIERNEQKYIDEDTTRLKDEWKRIAGDKTSHSMAFTHGYTIDPDERNVKTVLMNPKEFLETTHKQSQLKNPNYETYDKYVEDVLNRKSVDWHKKAIPSKKMQVEIPYLDFDKWGRPTGHEGRHTSQAAIELGMTEIPVTIIQKRTSREEDTPPREWQAKSFYENSDVNKFLNLPAYKDQAVAPEDTFTGDTHINNKTLAQSDKKYWIRQDRKREDSIRSSQQRLKELEAQSKALEASITPEQRVEELLILDKLGRDTTSKDMAINWIKRPGIYYEDISPERYFEIAGRPEQHRNADTDEKVGFLMSGPEGKHIKVEDFAKDIQDPHKTINVDAPYGYSEHNQEGRHRTLGAQIAGQSTLPAAIKMPSKYTSPEVFEAFKDKMGKRGIKFASSYEREWKGRFESGHPLNSMDSSSRQAYGEALIEKGLDTPWTESDTTSKDMAKVYHGTDALNAFWIGKEGIKTSKTLKAEGRMEPEQSDKTNPNKTYYFDNPEHALSWAKVVGEQSGIKPAVIEADIPDDKLVPDYNMKFGKAYSYEGDVPVEKIKILKDIIGKDSLFVRSEEEDEPTTTSPTLGVLSRGKEVYRSPYQKIEIAKKRGLSEHHFPSVDDIGYFFDNAPKEYAEAVDTIKLIPKGFRAGQNTWAQADAMRDGGLITVYPRKKLGRYHKYEGHERLGEDNDPAHIRKILVHETGHIMGKPIETEFRERFDIQTTPTKYPIKILRREEHAAKYWKQPDYQPSAYTDSMQRAKEQGSREDLAESFALWHPGIGSYHEKRKEGDIESRKKFFDEQFGKDFKRGMTPREEYEEVYSPETLIDEGLHDEAMRERYEKGSLSKPEVEYHKDYGKIKSEGYPKSEVDIVMDNLAPK